MHMMLIIPYQESNQCSCNNEIKLSGCNCIFYLDFRWYLHGSLATKYSWQLMNILLCIDFKIEQFL